MLSFNYRQPNNVILAAIVVLSCNLLYAMFGSFSTNLAAIILFAIIFAGATGNTDINAINYHRAIIN